MKTQTSSRAGYVIAVGVIAGFVSVVFVSAWSQMVPGFSGNRLITDGWVVSSLLLCLLIGNIYFGPRALAVPSPLRFLAYMQIGAGISGLVAVQILPAVGAVAGAVGGAGSTAGATVMAGLLTFGVFFVPCFLLGGIVAFYAEHTRVGNLTAPLFLGATAGVLFSTFILVPLLGYWRTLLVGAAMIALTGLIGLVLRGPAQSETPQTAGRADQDAAKTDVRVAGVASTIFITATLVCVILWARLLAQIIGQSIYAGAAVPSVYLAGVTIGSIVSSFVARRSGRTPVSLMWLAAAGGIYWLVISHVLNHTPSLFLDALGSGPLTWGRLLTGQFRVALMVMAVPGILTGLSLPLLEGRGSGRTAICPAALGGLLAFALTRALPAGDLSFRVALTFASWLCLASALAFMTVSRRPAWFKLVVSLVVIVAGVAASLSLPHWRREVVTSGVFNRLRELTAMEDIRGALRGGDIIFYNEKGDNITSVDRSPDGMALRTNGHIAASTGEDVVSQILTAQIPMLIHDAPGRVLLVGLGAGVTLGSIETHDVAEIVCVEPVASMRRAAGAFSHYNRDALRDDRLRLLTADPMNYLLSDRSFDVVILQSPSARSGRPGRFLSADYVARVRTSLAEKGIVCQRLSATQLPADAFGAAVRAFALNFPNVSLWWAGGGEMLLIGSMEPLNLDLESLDHRMSRPRIAEDLARIRITDHVGILGCYTADRAALVELAGDVPINTDDNAFIDHRVPMASVGHDPTEILKSVDLAKQNPITVVAGIDESSGQSTLLGKRLDRFMRARTLYVNSLVFAWTGRLSDAIAALEQATELSPENGIFMLRLSDYYIMLSRGLAAGGRQEEAVNAARKSVEAHPLSHRAFYNLATIEMSRNGPLAIALLRRATELNPGYVPAYLLKAEGELASGDAEGAGRTVGEVLSIEPFNTSALHLRALSLIERNMLDEGAAVLGTVLDTDPENIEAMDALAYLRFMEDDLAGAERLYKRILALDPDHLGALNNYATVLAEKGFYREAIRIWTKALGRDPGNRNIIDNIEEARQKLRK
ncbi:MAG: tetratricopeptide repeat protein [Candidatus Eisenbacteria bacterium]